ncbi:MFS general substrate transporter [Basidiobolus meristosporus CBS 931.73]|uniref:MFS general substrate transporter n=1 Tax=Basidiobolus meristosporus CBS 931.73 TaxID=1314790 RepID=A0A1Y1ZDL6_9FUNG|nr:MFS general substrate transporter [Basidiobolus meristosporus CBS 931.73]|eukprot:ORY08274.1 MFS general substrate transporter [Basidiobolus meristosporus CBS 931.73]
MYESEHVDKSSIEEHVSPANSIPQFKVYKIRYLVVLAVFLLNIAASVIWVTFSSVSLQARNYYNISMTIINLLSSLYMIMFVIFSLLSSWVLDSKGLKPALLVGAGLQIIGAWIRYFGTFINEENNGARLALAILGQVTAGAAQTFVLNAPTKMAAVWFPDNQRAMANTVASLANPLGAAVGMVLATSVCATPGQFPNALLAAAIFSTVAALPALIIPKRPATPPSVTASEPSDPFIPGLKVCFKHRYFWILALVFGVIVGIFNDIVTLLSEFINPYGYSDDDGSIFGVVLIVVGLVGGGICGVYLDRTKQFLRVLRVLMVLIPLSLIALIFSVRENDYVGICVNFGIIGFLAFAGLPVCLELGVETTYPVAEGTSSGILWMVAQFFGFITMFIMDALRGGPESNPPYHMRNSLIFSAVLVSAVCFLGLFFKSENRRQKASEHVVAPFQMKPTVTQSW